jgi:hypothetical protein
MGWADHGLFMWPVAGMDMGWAGQWLGMPFAWLAKVWSVHGMYCLLPGLGMFCSGH